jgi:hypothetical protein
MELIHITNSSSLNPIPTKQNIYQIVQLKLFPWIWNTTTCFVFDLSDRLLKVLLASDSAFFQINISNRIFKNNFIRQFSKQKQYFKNFLFYSIWKLWKNREKSILTIFSQAQPNLTESLNNLGPNEPLPTPIRCPNCNSKKDYK